jgi:plasmid stabilization system protein ParE
MAYRIIFQKRFIVKSAEVSKWIETEWSKKAGEEFVNRLYKKNESLRQTSLSGRPSAKNRQYRRLVITRHNVIYYGVKSKTIFIIGLVETKQTPKKDKYE